MNILWVLIYGPIINAAHWRNYILKNSNLISEKMDESSKNLFFLFAFNFLF